MNSFEKLVVDSVKNLKKPTIYFFLKNAGFSEHFVKNLRNTPSAIRLNGQETTINKQISVADIIEISKSPNKPTLAQECDGDLDILYEDEDYLVVNKPHNLACIPTRSHFANNLGGMILKYMHKTDPNFVLRIINRLDKETAGLVVVAKNVPAYNNISKVEKTYYALCNGKIDKDFTIDKPIKTETENGINKLKRIVSSDGKRATTHVYLCKNYADYSLVKLVLETGRTHQIRVHLSSENHALLGDTIYSSSTASHAFLLLKDVSFVHPKTRQKISLSCDFPKDWTDYLK